MPKKIVVRSVVHAPLKKMEQLKERFLRVVAGRQFGINGIAVRHVVTFGIIQIL